MQAERVVRSRGISGARPLVAAILTPDQTAPTRSGSEATITLKDDEPAAEPATVSSLLEDTVAVIRRTSSFPSPPRWPSRSGSPLRT